MAGALHFHELMAPGAALFDADGDGDLDLFLVQGARADPSLPPLRPEPPSAALRDRLFLNEPIDVAGGREPRFIDVTDAAGLGGRGYGMGAATGDFDNDGRIDLFVTRYGADQLWRNVGVDGEGRPRFEDVTVAAGVSDARWSTSAAAVDVDRDGWLDLYVVHYVDAPLVRHEICVQDSGAVEYCGPSSYPPLTDRLYRNLGLGEGEIRFEDASAATGLLARPGPGLGIAITDVEDDGWPELYIANDQAANVLWRVPGAWPAGQAPRLDDEAVARGVAMDEVGRAQASMGVVAADVDRDGDDDLFLTHLLREVNTLYRNQGGLFRDASRDSGLGNPSIGSTGFGVAAFDLENDGWLDVYVTNGAVRTIAAQRAAGVLLPLRQPDQLFTNRAGVFKDASARVPGLADPTVGRGVAMGDVDNDGDVDLLVTACDDRPRMWINRVGQDRAWIGLRLLTGRRDALGARVEVRALDAPPLVRRVSTTGSFLSAHDPRVVFGLDTHREPVDVEVRWPSGAVETWRGLAPGRYHQLVEGEEPS